ncbi:hypothetical protein OFN73_06195 [Campylobacter sp. JMF_14 EL1]|nr:hypothetical protein [Campylobacter sp. JMF_14 EL1]
MKFKNFAIYHIVYFDFVDCFVATAPRNDNSEQICTIVEAI